MNADDVFRYGHLTLIGCLEGLPAPDWETGGVCGVWSTREVMAHLASYERATAELFGNLVDERATPTLNLLLAQGEAFNQNQVEQRRDQTTDETLDEYRAAYEEAAALLAQIPRERRREIGLLPWYGAEYDLEDLIIYMSYGHKREYCAQIAEFRYRVESRVSRIESRE
jgi:hypothetical protein